MKIAFILLMMGLGFSSCKKFVNVPLPGTKIASTQIFDNTTSLTAALNGVYSDLATFGGASDDFTYGALLSDEMTSSLAPNYILAGSATYSQTTDFGLFSYYYTAIYNANYILSGIDQASAIPAATAKQIKGECLFLRAFCYFKLVNYYGTVPLVLGPDVSQSALAANTPVTDIYKSIIADLQSSTTLLTDTYAVTTRTRVNKETANTLLAKAYLYTKDYTNAVNSATAVINSGLYSLTTDLNSVFYSNSNETIWQYWNAYGYTLAANGYVPSNTASIYFLVRPELVASFETGDLRKSSWIKPGTGVAANSYYPYKWKLKATTAGMAEYLIQFRLAEVYLIRAEAYAQLNNLTAGMADLYKVRSRAGLTGPLNYADTQTLVSAINTDKRKELMFESANRWFDLNRTNQTVTVLAPLKPGFTSHLMLLPFPATAINTNPNLVQNPGYN